MRFKIFKAANGAIVKKFVTPSGVTGYVDASIPVEALEGLKKKLEKRIASKSVERKCSKPQR